MDFTELYAQKKMTAAQAAALVKSGDWVDYGWAVNTPVAVDAELAKRLPELEGVNFRGGILMWVPAIFQIDDPAAHMTWNSWHMGGIERKAIAQGFSFYSPIRYSELPRYYRESPDPLDVAVFQVTPMDEHGYFNFGPSASHLGAVCEKAKKIVVEVNKNMPRCLGGMENCIHISQVTGIVEGENPPIGQMAAPGAATEVDLKVANLIVPQIPNGACLQLGIGGMPNAIGSLIAQSDLKDLGVHTEMYVDAFVDIAKAGKITGARKQLDKGTASARLTISADVQKAALQALGSYHGTVGVYNYKTGEILCAVTSPSYDPDNIPDIAGDETGDYDGVYLNRFFDAAYTPGSIFKLVTSAAALEADAASKDQTYTCTGETIIGGQEIICMGEHGTLSMTQALAHSCNVYYGELAAALGKDKLQAAADRLGLNGTLRCDGYTARSTVDLSDADEGSVAWAGIGQYTDQVTALQFLRFMGVIAGGGEAAEPYLMQKISRAGQTVYEAKTETTGQLLSAATATTLGGMMRSAVVNQYGAWQFGALTVCAKSGTAERENGPADAMFAGFVQDEAYPLAFVVFAEQGGSGSQIAAPIAAKVLTACKTMLDTPNPNS